jgi:hypothetical protein
VNQVLLTAGAASIILAVVGGGARAFGIEVPVLDSVARQVALGLVGVAFLIGAVFVGDGLGDGGSDEGVKAYRQEVLAACRSVGADRGLPPINQDGTFEHDAYITWLNRQVDASEDILDALWKRPVPDGLADDATEARTNANDLVAQSRAAVGRLSDLLPSRFDIRGLGAASAGVQSLLREPTARLEESMSRLAGEPCSATSPASNN